MSAPLLEVHGLEKHFPVRGGWLRRTVGRLRAVDGVSFTLQAGRTLGLVGESGCGKSTLGRAILRLQEPTAGRVLLEGRDITAMPAAELVGARRRMQIIFQDPYASLNPRRTVGQAIREPLDVHRIGTPGERDARVLELLDTVGLPAQALSPALIVADEPVSALDVSVQGQVLNLVARLQREHGIAFLFISHDLAVIQHVSDAVAVMYLGRIVEYGPAALLYREPQHPYTQALLSAVPMPNPAGRRRRIVLPGEPPSPVAPPAGCAFHPRCPRAQAICRVERPGLRNLPGTDPASLVACHFPGPG